MNYSSLMSEVVCWRKLQDNADSTVLLDDTPEQNGILIGGGTTASKSVTGPGNGMPLALDLDGIADYCSLPTPDVSAAGTIAIRFRLDSVPSAVNTNAFLLCTRNNNTNSRIYAAFPDGTTNLRVLFAHGSYTQIGTLDLDQWYSLVIAWEGDDAAFYLDGILMAEQTRAYSGGWLGRYAVGGFDQGSPGTVSDWLDCTVADSPVWDRKLSADESMIWHAGPGGVVPGIIPNLRGVQSGPNEVNLTWAAPFPAADAYDVRVDGNIVATGITPEVI